MEDEEKDQTKRTRSYVEEAFRQIQAQPDVRDILVLNAVGNPVKSTMDDQSSIQHAGHIELLLQKAKYTVQLLDESDDLIYLRVRTKYHEIIITPDEKLTFFVVQDPVDKMQRKAVN